jgi:hypothetical protein
MLTLNRSLLNREYNLMNVLKASLLRAQQINSIYRFGDDGILISYNYHNFGNNRRTLFYAKHSVSETGFWVLSPSSFGTYSGGPNR